MGKIHDIVLYDPKLKVRELAKAADISIGSVVKILQEDLGLRMLTPKLVPCFLAINKKTPSL